MYYKPGGNSRSEGPFTVASVSSEGKYLLAWYDPDEPDELKAAKDGMEIDEEHLQAVKA